MSELEILLKRIDGAIAALEEDFEIYTAVGGHGDEIPHLSVIGLLRDLKAREVKS